METAAAKLVPIGNSVGIRLPKSVRLRHQLKDRVLLVDTPQGLLIRPADPGTLSWQDTYRDMATHAQVAEHPEDWSEWDAVVNDGLDSLDD